MRQENLQSKGGFKSCISKEVNEEVGDGCDEAPEPCKALWWL